MSELKPCPFCGGEARQIDIDAPKPSVPDAGASYIACGRCYACSPIMFGEKTGLEEAWNRRALSTIEADAKPQEPSEGARDFAMQILDWTDPLPYYESETKHVNRAAVLITAHDDAIRRECAGKAETALDEIERCMLRLDKPINTVYGPVEPPRMQMTKAKRFIRAAILGTEPAREGS